MADELHGSVKYSVLLFICVYIYAEVMSTFAYAKPVVEMKAVKLKCFKATHDVKLPQIQLGLTVHCPPAI